MLLKRLLDLEKAPAARRYGAEEYNLAGFREWLETLGSPHEGQPFIHIAGTKGKGSTAAISEAILQNLGFATALFSSPHLRHYGERFRFDGEPWSEEEFDQRLEVFESRLGPDQRAGLDGPIPFRTVFEVLTALALTEFRDRQEALRRYVPARQQVVCWETGLGGRLDCTNVVDPVVTVITTLGLDHTRILGETIQQIAHEKAGILKAQRPVVLSRQAPEFASVVENIVVAHSRPLEAPVVRAWEFVPILHSKVVEEGTLVRMEFPDGLQAESLLPLAGHFQLANLQAAVTACWLAAEEMGRRPDPESIVEAWSNVVWPGRFEVHRLPGDRTVVLDGAHCPLSARVLAEALLERDMRPVALLFGMQADKNHIGFLNAFRDAMGPGAVAEVVCYQVPGPRGADPDMLRYAAEAAGLRSVTFATPEEAFAHATGNHRRVVSAGTLYTIAPFRDLLKGLPRRA